LIFWIRGTYPRLRIDQLMAFGWKLLVPLSFLNVVITSVVLFYGFSHFVLSAISIFLTVVLFYMISNRSKKYDSGETVSVVSASQLRDSQR